MPWTIVTTSEVEAWMRGLASRDRDSFRHLAAALDVLAEEGSGLGRPLVDQISHSTLTNMKELRPPSSGRTKIRILFVFDPQRQAVLLVAGDKSGEWNRWYKKAIRKAERLYEAHLATLASAGRT